MKKYITALGIILMLAGSAPAKEKGAKISAADMASQKTIEAPAVKYSTTTGVTLGSTSFAAIRAYAGNKYEDDIVWVTFKGLGLLLLISVDHMVYGITVMAPE